MWFVSYIKWKKNKPQERRRSERLKELGGGWHDPQPYYQSCTIYKLRVPKEILERSWSSNSWEREYFIRQSDLEDVSIVSKETYRDSELMKMANRQIYIKHEIRSKNTEKIAKSLRSNLAAKYYLILMEKYRNLLMQGKSFDDEQKRRIKILFQKLQDYFLPSHYGMPTIVHKVENPHEVEKIVVQINELLE